MAKTANIWVVEDDEDIREIVLYALGSVNFETKGFECGQTFFERLKNESSIPDLLLLDIMLPDEDGLTILKRIRQSSDNYKDIPVMMLTAKGSEHDKVKGLDLGADDYLAKPFGVMELISRVKALLRRSSKALSAAVYSYQNIRINHEKRTVEVESENITLTYKEYELLYYLITNKGIVLSRDKILDAVWGYDYEGESRAIDMHVKRLRHKLGASGEHIKTIRNVGYMMGD